MADAWNRSAIVTRNLLNWTPGLCYNPADR
jgi:hypothetical protein